MLFDLNDNKIVINPDSLTLPEFNVLWKRDKTKEKEVAYKEISYIYYMVDYKSPYTNYDQHKKEEIVSQDVFKGPYKPDAAVKAAIHKYTILQETPEMRLLKAWDKKIDEIANYLNNTNVDDDNISNQVKVGVDMEKVITAKQKLRDIIIKQTSGTSAIRGNKSLGLFSEE